MKAPFRRTDYYRHQRWMGMIWMLSIPMIDQTNFGAVRMHLQSPESMISTVVLLSEEYRLEELAALCVEGSSYCEAMFLGLISRNAVRFAIDGPPNRVDGINQIPVVQIPDEIPCDAVYLPPAYLVQLRTT